MEKKILTLTYGLIFSLISLLSLFYINYYEEILYYKPINRFLDIMYEYIAIPCFYYFIAALITVFVIYLLKINIHQRLGQVLKYALGLTLILYVILIFLNILRIIVLPYIAFYSVYSIIFAVLGCLFPFTKKIKIKKER